MLKRKKLHFVQLLTILLCAAFLSNVFIADSQAQEAKIYMKSRIITTDKSMGVMSDDIDTLLNQGQRIHVLMQFDTPPDEAQRLVLKNAGVILLNYIPDNTWLVSLPPDFKTQVGTMSDQVSGQIRYIGKLTALDKIAPDIAGGQFGDWAKNPDGTVNLWVEFFKDTDLNDISALITSLGGQVQKEMPEFSRLIVSLPTNKLMELAEKDAIQWINQVPTPSEPLNDGARSNVRTDMIHAKPASPSPLQWGLTGNGVVASVWDGAGADTHTDFGDRITIVDNDSDYIDHATHVCGTMAGDGANSIHQGGSAFQWKGIAPAANILSYFWENDISKYTDAINQRNADLSQNSWGVRVAEAEWLAGNCDKYGDYDNLARSYDRIITDTENVYDRKIPIVFAAGNERNDGDCGMSGTFPFVNYGNILFGGQTAKNTITVGAINSDDYRMTEFSSWGPTDDGRIKPEIVGPGDESGANKIKSTTPSGKYANMGGTSMAAPVVSGGIALILERYRQACSNNTASPLPSTLKALLIHTARDLDDNTTTWFNSGPDYASGYGAVDVRAAVEMTPFHVEGAVGNGQTDEYKIAIVPQYQDLKVTLVWDDPPSAPNAGGPALVNNLDLELVRPDGVTVHYPWILDKDNPDSPAVKGVDNINTVEQVSVTIQPQMAGSWTIRVKGTHVPNALSVSGKQSYSLVSQHLASSSCNGEITDVWAKDNSSDTGVEPNPNSILWRSPDIFIRTNDADGHINPAHQGHQNPEFGQTNYAYVKVRNKGNHTAYNVRVFFYIWRSMAGLSWPQNWELIGTSTIAEIPANGLRIIEPIHFEPKAKGHQCASVRILTPQDPRFSEMNIVPGSVRGYNNYIQKNLHVVDLKTNQEVKAEFVLRNAAGQQALVNMIMQARDQDGQIVPLGNNGNIIFNLPEAMVNRIQGPVEGVEIDPNQVLGDGLIGTVAPNAPDGGKIGGIDMQPGEEFEIELTFKAPAGDAGENFNFDIVNEVNGEVMGGITYEVRNQETGEEDDSGAIDIGASAGACGKTLSVPVRINNAPNEVKALGFEVTYDSAILTYTGFSKGSLTQNFGDPLGDFDVNMVAPGVLRCGGYRSVNGIAVGASGSVAFLKFKIADDCDESELQLANLEDDISGWSVSAGKFTPAVCGASGDVNGDSEITPQDALCAFEKYMTICPTSCGIDCNNIDADVNCDGDTTPADALCIFNKYLGKTSCMD